VILFFTFRSGLFRADTISQRWPWLKYYSWRAVQWSETVWNVSCINIHFVEKFTQVLLVMVTVNDRFSQLRIYVAEAPFASSQTPLDNRDIMDWRRCSGVSFWLGCQILTHILNRSGMRRCIHDTAESEWPDFLSCAPLQSLQHVRHTILCASLMAITSILNFVLSSANPSLRSCEYTVVNIFLTVISEGICKPFVTPHDILCKLMCVLSLVLHSASSTCMFLCHAPQKTDALADKSNTTFFFIDGLWLVTQDPSKMLRY
jgi:hypothetical protein